MWKELGEALGDLAGTGERVNMVSAASSGTRARKVREDQDGDATRVPRARRGTVEGCGAAIEEQEPRVGSWTDGELRLVV